MSTRFDETDIVHWPRKGDRLLRPAPDFDRGVEFDRDSIARHVHIWSGYMIAATALVDTAEGDPLKRHSLVYPILFNYRHALELAMKWLIARYGRYAHVDEPPAKDHDLWKMWRLCRQIIEEIGGDDEALEIVEQLVKDFHDLDRSALSFRYATDKNGTPITLPREQIDLNNVRRVMEGVDRFFGGVDGLLDANVSAVPW